MSMITTKDAQEIGKIAGAITLGNAINGTVTGWASPVIMAGLGLVLKNYGWKNGGNLLITYGVLNGVKRIAVKDQNSSSLFARVLPGSVNPGAIGLQGFKVNALPQ